MSARPMTKNAHAGLRGANDEPLQSIIIGIIKRAVEDFRYLHGKGYVTADFCINDAAIQAACREPYGSHSQSRLSAGRGVMPPPERIRPLCSEVIDFFTGTRLHDCLEAAQVNVPASAIVRGLSHPAPVGNITADLDSTKPEHSNTAHSG